MKYWLIKTESNTYSIDDLKRDGMTSWDGVRNFQARNNLKDMKIGDLALVYHSGKERAIVGIAKIVRESYPDKTAIDGDWVAVDVAFKETFLKPLELSKIKTIKELSNLKMLKQSRLSVSPVNKEEWQIILKLCQ